MTFAKSNVEEMCRSTMVKISSVSSKFVLRKKTRKATEALVIGTLIFQSTN